MRLIQLAARILRAAGLAGMAVVIAACSSPPPPAPQRPPPANGSRPVTVELTGAPAGTATLSWDEGTQKITAAITMYGFTPNSRHAMQIYPGSCAKRGKPPTISFPDVQVDGAGVASKRVDSGPVPAGIPTGSYLTIHLASMAKLGSRTAVSATPIACADIPPDLPSTGPVTLTLQPPPRKGQAPEGSATLNYNSTNKTLRVQIKASGLEPNREHAVHIHSGACASQGSVLYTLPDFTVDSEGDVSVDDTVTEVPAGPQSSGWYLDVHFGPGDEIIDSGQPTMLFAPILCGDISG
jgi:Cu/Zn superoxide dismutase